MKLVDIQEHRVADTAAEVVDMDSDKLKKLFEK